MSPEQHVQVTGLASVVAPIALGDFERFYGWLLDGEERRSLYAGDRVALECADGIVTVELLP